MNPYDVVIDGLNVAYSVKKINSKGELSGSLQNVRSFK